MSRWAALASAWTPESVRLEMWNLTGALGFRFCAAFWNPKEGGIQQNFRKNILLLADHTSLWLPEEFGAAVG